MHSREEIIEGLKWCIRADKQCTYALVDCPFVEECKIGNSTALKEEALYLLTDIAPYKKDMFHWYCGRCGARLLLKRKPKFCIECGTKIGVKKNE